MIKESVGTNPTVQNRRIPETISFYYPTRKYNPEGNAHSDNKKNTANVLPTVVPKVEKSKQDIMKSSTDEDNPLPGFHVSTQTEKSTSR